MSSSATAYAHYVAGEQPKDLLRFITCGSVDDGKSTLIGRLLHDSGSVAEDVIAAARADSARWGTTGDELDLALLVDGLQSEREQGITIDVAHRYFDTPRRKYILADTPGHEQYTRNMATGASGADLAILLVDASQGLLAQTRRHAFIVRLLGIRQVVVAVNKMDRVGYEADAFHRVERQAREAFASLGFAALHVVPVSALRGDNVVHRSSAMAWYDGPTLLDVLERAPGAGEGAPELRFPVQYVSRPNAEFRGYAGTVAAGSLAVGDAVVALPSGARSSVASISTPDGARSSAIAGEAVVVTLADPVDVGRGQVLAHPERPPSVVRSLEADVVWMADAPFVAGRRYEFKFAHRYVPGSVARIVHRVDVASYAERPVEQLTLNDIGRCELSFAEPVAVDTFDEHAVTGSFIVIDLDTHATVGAGLVRRTGSGRLVAQSTPVTRAQRAAQKHQRPFVLWFTGLSGSGKSTIAAAVEQALVARGHHTYLLDGDRVRQGLNADLGFGELDRRENLRRIAEVARTLVDAGLIVLAACISPQAKDRSRVRELLGTDYVEVFVDTPLAECERRDPKGHYRRARAGTLAQFTGVSAPYEVPTDPELHLRPVPDDVERAVREVLEFLGASGRVDAASDGDWVI
jgi:bifunctional enzyme CysN/CysC